jgi:hypothetical protein
MEQHAAQEFRQLFSIWQINPGIPYYYYYAFLSAHENEQFPES